MKKMLYEGRRTIIESALNWEDKQRTLFNLKRDQWERDRAEGKMYPASHYISLARQEIESQANEETIAKMYGI